MGLECLSEEQFDHDLHKVTLAYEARDVHRANRHDGTGSALASAHLISIHYLLSILGQLEQVLSVGSSLLNEHEQPGCNAMHMEP